MKPSLSLEKPCWDAAGSGDGGTLLPFGTEALVPGEVGDQGTQETLEQLNNT